MPHEIEISLVRHGETVKNTLHRLQGHEDSPLTEKGLIHAQEVAAQIHQSLLEEQVGGLIGSISQVALWTSDLGRCIQTAQIIARTLNIPEQAIVKNDLLRERNYGSYSGTNTQEFFDLWIAQRTQDGEKGIPVWDTRLGGDNGAETYFSMAERISQFFGQITDETPLGDSRRMIAVTSGAYMHAALLLLGAETEQTLDARNINNMAQIDVGVAPGVRLTRKPDNNLSLTNVSLLGVHNLRKSANN